jgi:VWFA-related protein
MSDLTWMVLLFARATAILLVGGLLAVLLRRSSASARHAVLGLTVAGLLVLPLVSTVLPSWEIAVLPPERPVARAGAAGPLSFVADHPGRAGAPPLPPREGHTGHSARSSSVVTSAAPARETSATAAVPREPWPALAWLAVAWIAGTLVGLLQIGRSAFLARRTRERAAALVEAAWTGEVEDAAAVLGLRRGVRLLMSDALRVPVVHGFRPPAILLPTSAVHWPEDRRRAFLLHELAHVRRQDWPMQMLGHLARALYWPHPLAWWLARRLRVEAERASDDCVLLTGTPASDYAAHLLQAARDLGQTREHEAVLAAVERSHFEDRLIALLDPQLSRRALDRRTLGFAAVMALAVVVSVAGLQPVAQALAETPGRAGQDDRAARSAPVPGRPRLDHLDESGLPPRSLPAMKRDAGPAGRSPDAGAPSLVEPSATPGSGVDADTDPLDEETGDQEAVVPPALPDPQPSATPAVRSRPVIRISTDMVQIDAVITNKEGEGVVDLRPEDFEVFEDGRRQTVSHLQYVAAGPAKTGSGVRTPGATSEASEAGEPRTFVFVIDNLGLSLEGTVRARRLMQSFVTTGLQPRDRAAIIETSATAGGTFALTSDPEVLSAAAAKIHHVVWSRGGLDAFPSRQLDVTSRNSQLVLDSLAVLKTTIDGLRALPGRKSVILVSDGFVTRISTDVDRLMQRFTATPVDALYEDTSLYGALRGLTDLASRASVVIYTLDAMGLQALSVGRQGLATGTTVNAGVDRNGADTRSDDGQLTSAGYAASEGFLQRSTARMAREDSLIEIAELTGGLAVISNNDLAGGLARIVKDLSGYYLIGYVPDQATFESRPGPPRFHEVKVQVKRPGLKVRSRKGFYGVTDEFVAQASPPK